MQKAMANCNHICIVMAIQLQIMAHAFYGIMIKIQSTNNAHLRNISIILIRAICSCFSSSFKLSFWNIDSRLGTRDWFKLKPNFKSMNFVRHRILELIYVLKNVVCQHSWPKLVILDSASHESLCQKIMYANTKTYPDRVRNLFSLC